MISWALRTPASLSGPYLIFVMWIVSLMPHCLETEIQADPGLRADLSPKTETKKLARTFFISVSVVKVL